MNTRIWMPIAFSAALLAACGGGGGDNNSAPPAASNGVSLSGVAAKGALAAAHVEVHAVKAGALDAAIVAQADSGADGAYQLPKFINDASLQYVMVVKAKANGSTSHLDEVTGARQPLPADFSLRAFLPAFDTRQGDATGRVHVTPFSELAVAAAEKGQFAPGVVAQTLSNVQQLIGFDPRTVQPATIAAAVAGTDAAAKANQGKLAVLLTAFSQLAKDGALGCVDADAGKRAKCIVDTFAAAYTVANTKPGTAASAALSAAINTTLEAHAAEIEASVVSGIVGNLSPSNTGTPAPVGSADAITATKALFDELRTDVMTVLLGGRSSTTYYAVDAQARLFKNALSNTQEPLTPAAKDADALLLGAQLYSDYKSGRVTSINSNRSFCALPSNQSLQSQPTVDCALFQDAELTLPTTSQENANFVGCASRFFREFGFFAWDGTPAPLDYVHYFILTPTGVGAFEYKASARKGNAPFTYAYGGSWEPLSPKPPAAAFQGSIHAALVSDVIQSLSIAGDLPALFAIGHGSGLYNQDGKSTWTINAARSVTGDRETLALDGNITTYWDQGTTVASTLNVKAGSQVVLIGGEWAEGSVALQAGNAQARFEGSLMASNSAVDRSGLTRVPLDLSLEGHFSNINDSGQFVDFATGAVTAHVTAANWAAYDTTKAASSSNQYSASFSFTGSVTAPTRPTLALQIGFSAKSFDETTTGLTAQYKTVAADGSVLRVIAIDGSTDTGLTFTEAANGITFSIVPNVTVTPVTRNGTKVAELDRQSHRVTFSNGDFISLDFGL